MTSAPAGPAPLMPVSRPRSPWPRRLLLWGLPLHAALCLGAGMAIVWGPLWLHWRVDPQPVPPQVIEAGRRQPDDRVLATVAETSMTTDHPLRGDDAVTVARRWLATGELALPHLPVIRADPGFDRSDLSQGVPVQHIFTASLILPDLLLRAHEHAPNPAFVAAALRYTRGFILFEESVLVPRDYERNSHATANRASVLARLWKHVRAAPDYEADTGRLVHLHAQRLGALLSKPSTFIAATNHGVMQNIGLLQLAAAFPALPEAAAWRSLALQRLTMQLPGWISPEGTVLEHSSGYHFHGVVLSGYVVKLLEASGQPVPPEWAEAHARARDFMATLQRPDRTLPPYGNTFRYAWRLPSVLGVDEATWERELHERPAFTRHYPLGGHAVWWDPRSAAGPATHTHLPWGHFAGHGHRRAQELSLLVWSAGTEWSTNTGYWPSGDLPGIRMTDGWSGSNAPHVVGEGDILERRGRLLSQAEAEGLRFIDLEREAPAGADGTLRIRRQVLQLDGSHWIVLDSHADPLQRALRVLWTSAPETSQRRGVGLQWHIERPGSPVAMALHVQGSPGFSVAPLRGSTEPFGGWVAFDRRAEAAPALDARAAGPGSWLLTTLSLHATGPQAGTPLKATMVRHASPEDWTLRIEPATGESRPVVEWTRQGALLAGRPGSHGAGGGAASRVGNPREVTLVRSDPVPVETARASIAQARAKLLAAWPRYRTNEWSRRRWSDALVVAWAVGSLLIVAAAASAWWHTRRAPRSRS